MFFYMLFFVYDNMNLYECFTMCAKLNVQVAYYEFHKVTNSLFRLFFHNISNGKLLFEKIYKFKKLLKKIS